MSRNLHDAFKKAYLVRQIENSQKREPRDPILWEFNGMLQEFTAEIKTLDKKTLGESVVSVYWRMPLQFEERLNSGNWMEIFLFPPLFCQ